MASFTLTTNADTFVGDAADDTVNGTAATLNATDSLTGDGGLDTLALTGSGSFRVDQLTTFTGFERITLDNATTSSATLKLGAQPIEVDTTGTVAIQIDSPANWNGSNIVHGDAAGNMTTLNFWGPQAGNKPTYDLTSNTFSQVKISLMFGTLLINSAAMAGVESVRGDTFATNAHLKTADATLDLTHTSVYMGWNKNGEMGITSTNASGTTFKVADFDTAMEVGGGPGQDTLVATGFTFTASQRHDFFVTRSVEQIVDPSGTWGGPGADTFVFDATVPATATHIHDYDQGNSGTFNQAEGDALDLSALLSAGSGQPVGNLVKVLENGSNSGAIVQVDQDGSANGTHWTTVALLDGVHAGNGVKVIFDTAQPAATLTVPNPAPRYDFNG
ncbi:MAG TPA: type I secretion C-terminal target domain-containing protein, partial [Bradyrhizobium sp.]|nr:type I secretion C-terminal target domain-containing protein [Bradyrhizobium sp.]